MRCTGKSTLADIIANNLQLDQKKKVIRVDYCNPRRVDVKYIIEKNRGVRGATVIIEADDKQLATRVLRDFIYYTNNPANSVQTIELNATFAIEDGRPGIHSAPIYKDQGKS